MARAILGWDQHTKMPPKGGEVRAEQLGTLDRFSHELFIDDEIGRLLDEARDYEEEAGFDSNDGSLIRITRRDYEKAKRVPPELRAEMTRVGAMALPAWIDAREKSDFSTFLPHLKKNLELTHRYIDCCEGMGYESEYDVLLDDFDEGLTGDEVRTVFDELKRELVPLIAQIAENSDRVDDSSLHGDFPIEKQRSFALEVLQRMGFDHEAWRLDPTVHPFAMSAGTKGIRLTTRYDETDLSVSLFATIHEFGRGLPIWRHFYPRLQKTFPAQFGDVELETYYGAINKVEPSFIRVEADEVTYNMHIILRFELEQEMLSGRLPLEDLPEAWNARMSEYLGIDVPNDSQGVLQDVHWSGGAFGYFPTYSLGNVVSVQLWEKLTAELPDLTSQLERGEFDDLAGWLRENLHQHGRKYTSKEMLQRITGGGMDPAPYIRYLKAKMGEIYGLPVETAAPA